MTNDENIIDETEFDPNRKKKSKKRIIRDVLAEATVTTDSTNNTPGDETANEIPTEESDFSYEYLITRAFDILREKNPEDFRMRLILPPPQVGRIGTRRTSVMNFPSLCKSLKRQEKQLYDYFIAELGTTAAIDSDHALIIKGRLSQRQIENILYSFIRDYVICKTCHSPDTLLEKENRLTVIKCNCCRSLYSVSSIRTGFQAQIGKRSKGAQ